MGDLKRRGVRRTKERNGRATMEPQLHFTYMGRGWTRRRELNLGIRSSGPDSPTRTKIGERGEKGGATRLSPSLGSSSSLAAFCKDARWFVAFRENFDLCIFQVGLEVIISQRIPAREMRAVVEAKTYISSRMLRALFLTSRAQVRDHDISHESCLKVRVTNGHVATRRRTKGGHTRRAV